MLCSFFLYSKVIQLYIQTFFFYILFHCGLSLDIEYIQLYSKNLFFVKTFKFMVCFWKNLESLKT